MNNEVFDIGDQDIKQNKVKIGRKIPDSVEKYYEFDNENMSITSPEIFRVMIKWITKL